MNTNLIREDVQEYIHSNINSDPFKIILSKALFNGISNKEIADQIISINKLKNKNPEWVGLRGIVFPPPLSAEQSSSSVAAKYKAEILNGHEITDLTGGMGADSLAFSEKYSRVIYVEADNYLAALAKYNFELISKNIEVIHNTAQKYLNNLKNHTDIFFIDPARRNTDGDKVYRFIDCSPNIFEILPKLKQYSKEILIKASPLFDIEKGIFDLRDVAEVHVVSIDDDCKELLFKLNQNPMSEPTIFAVELGKNGYNFSFKPSEEKNQIAQYSNPQKYLYLPGTSILKSGSFNLVGNRYGLSKIAPNTHIYTSNEIIEEFPGRVFENVGELKKLDLHTTVNLNQINIISKNYPDAPEKIAKKLKIKQGGHDYLLAFRTNENKPVMCFCRKM